ncbi:MAG TPA: hypothetical protein VKU77_06215 [Streptosporangiaceae bacterium]|nr:hypothetical protein [Streptosporangiaceae bacterium]
MDGRPLVTPVWFIVEFGNRNGVPGELTVRLRPIKVLPGFNLTG